MKFPLGMAFLKDYVSFRECIVMIPSDNDHAPDDIGRHGDDLSKKSRPPIPIPA